MLESTGGGGGIADINFSFRVGGEMAVRERMRADIGRLVELSAKKTN